MIIEVYRGAGTRVGSLIIEPMLSDSALLVRGTAEMNLHAHSTNHVVSSIVPKSNVKLGQLFECIDPLNAIPVRSKVVGISISISEADISMNVDLEQPQ